VEKFKFHLLFSLVILISLSALIHGRTPKSPQIPSTEDESSEIQNSSGDIKPETSINTSINTTILVKDSSSEDVSNTPFTEKESTISSSSEGKIFNTNEFTEEPISTSIKTTEEFSNTYDIFTENTIPSTDSFIEPSTYFKTPSSIMNTTNFIDNDTNLSTIPLTTIPSTIPDTIPNVDTSLVLLGFSHFKKYDFNISFLTHFVYLKGKIYSKNLKYPVQISYKRFLRLLENYEANCTNIRESSGKISYLCNIQIETQNIDNIKIIPNFNFILDKPLVFISPLSAIYMDNIEKVEGELDILLNSNLYILSHSQIQDEKNESFTITGTINGPKPNFQKIKVNLKTNVEYQNKTSQAELNCNIIDIVNNKYTLRCKGEEKRTYILQHSTSFIGDEILLINFDENEVNRITIDDTKGKGLSAGGAIAIIIIIIFMGMYI